MAEKLERTLDLKDAISIVAGSMIGCGIFIVSSDIARQVDSAWLMLIVWLTAGLTTILGAMCYGELSATIPSEGGQYIYLKKIFSERMAFVYGWTLLLVIQTGTIAAINIALAKFIGIIVPQISSHIYLFQFYDYKFSTQQLFAILMVLSLTFINSRGIKSAIFVQNLFTLTKILSLVAIIFCGIFWGLNWNVIMQNFSPINNQIPQSFLAIKTIGVATVGALFTSITWNNVTFITSEIKKPAKNIPRALLIGTGLVIGLYFLINLIYMGTLPLEIIKTVPEDIVAAGLINRIFGLSGMTAIAIIISISAFGCANGMILTGSRVYYKMAKDRLLFRRLAFIDRKTKVPVNSLWFQCLWICALIFWGNYTQLLDYVIYASLIFYAITIFGIFKMRKMYKEEEVPYKVHTLIPVTFLVISISIVIMLTIYKPHYTVPGLLISLLGVPVYYLWKNKKIKN
jgi:APA family basic amino acid/polyamine antiporter